jgi:hypothetical protein
MRATLTDGRTIRIIFSHDAPVSTGCFLSDVSKNETDGYPFVGESVIGIGSARVHPLDQFSKSEGRKMSLKRALEDANLDREDRRLVWSAYHNRNVASKHSDTINVVGKQLEKMFP